MGEKDPYKATSPCGKVPATEAALPLCTASPSLCLRKRRERESPVRLATRAPMSLQMDMADSPQVPKVSMATGEKRMLPGTSSSAYFERLLASAVAAAAPAKAAEEVT